MRLRYNAPATLTFAIIAVCVFIVDETTIPDLIEKLFTAEGSLAFQPDNIPSYFRMVSHVFGHLTWDHLLGNITLILLLGPILEEKYSTHSLGIMIFITALVNGAANAIFFKTELLGASGIVFMMIVLISFANIRDGEIPITMLLVIGLYLFKEIMSFFKEDDISQISHILGGACGCLFGFSRRFSGGKSSSGSQGVNTIAS